MDGGGDQNDLAAPRTQERTAHASFECDGCYSPERFNVNFRLVCAFPYSGGRHRGGGVLRYYPVKE